MESAASAASARLRRTFRYPEDDEAEPLEGIDEQEQDELIDDLRKRDAEQTSFYIIAFLALPLLAALTYLPHLLFLSSPGRGGETRASAFISALLAVSSFCASAYVLYFLRLPPNFASRRTDGTAPWNRAFSSDIVISLIGSGDADGPVDKFIIPLNAALSMLLAMRGWVKARGDTEQVAWGALPLIVFIVVLAARAQLRPVDVGGLETLKYRYKGA